MRCLQTFFGKGQKTTGEGRTQAHSFIREAAKKIIQLMASQLRGGGVKAGSLRKKELF